MSMSYRSFFSVLKRKAQALFSNKPCAMNYRVIKIMQLRAWSLAAARRRSGAVRFQSDLCLTTVGAVTPRHLCHYRRKMPFYEMGLANDLNEQVMPVKPSAFFRAVTAPPGFHLVQLSATGRTECPRLKVELADGVTLPLSKYNALRAEFLSHPDNQYLPAWFKPLKLPSLPLRNPQAGK